MLSFQSRKKKNNNTIIIDGRENDNQIKLRKKFVKHHNPFLETLKKGDKKEIELISQS